MSTCAASAILNVGDWLQVLRIHTSLFATEMIELHPLWDGAAHLLPDVPMSPKTLAIDHNVDIPGLVRLTGSNPTWRGKIAGAEERQRCGLLND